MKQKKNMETSFLETLKAALSYIPNMFFQL